MYSSLKQQRVPGWTASQAASSTQHTLQIPILQYVQWQEKMWAGNTSILADQLPPPCPKLHGGYND